MYQIEHYLTADGQKDHYTEWLRRLVDMQVKVFQAETTAAIEEEKLRVSAQTANQALAQKIAESRSNLHAQMVASGLSAMHVQASISSSHGTGQDVSVNYSYAEKMDEDHSESVSYNENKAIP